MYIPYSNTIITLIIKFYFSYAAGQYSGGKNASDAIDFELILKLLCMMFTSVVHNWKLVETMINESQ